MNTPKTTEATVEQYAQSIQDMYFLSGAKINVESWKNTKDFIRNALTAHTHTILTQCVEKIESINFRREIDFALYQSKIHGYDNEERATKSAELEAKFKEAILRTLQVNDEV